MNQPIFSYYSTGELLWQMALLFAQVTLVALVAAAIAYAILTGVDKLKAQKAKPKQTLWTMYDEMVATKVAKAAEQEKR